MPPVPSKCHLTFCQCCPPTQDDTLKELSSHIQVGTIDGVHYDLRHAWIFKPVQFWIEQDLRSPETLMTKLGAGCQYLPCSLLLSYLDCIAIGKPEFFLFFYVLFFLGRVHGNKAAFLLDHPHHLLLRTCVKIVACLSQVCLQRIRYITTCYINSPNRERHAEAFVHGNGMCDAIAGVQYDSCRAPRSISIKTHVSLPYIPSLVLTKPTLPGYW